MAFGFETTGAEIVESFKDRVSGNTFLITGPTPGGIGAETALSLAAAKPEHLILAGRSRDKIQPLIDRINQDHPNVKVTFVRLDLGCLKSVRQAAQEVEAELGGFKIDVLILNAAVMACPYGLTEGGVEAQFATNHLGHFLFSNLLLKADLITRRIVVVSSSASHRSAALLMPHLEDLTYSQGKKYVPMTAYGLSKACNVLYAKRLANRPVVKNRGISVFSLNPGSIKTNLQGYLSEEARKEAIEAARRDNPNFRPPVPKTLQQGCATQLRAALDPSLPSETGAYLDDCQVVTLPEHKEQEAYIDQVWTISERLVGEQFDF